MAIAETAALRSKDPATQVGACIVDSMNRVVALGYNGFPRGCDDHDPRLSWERPAKYMFVIHAEANAILNKNMADISGCTLYTTLFPCNECAKLIIQSGITEVVYKENKYPDQEAFKASRVLFEVAGTRVRTIELECPDVE